MKNEDVLKEFLLDCTMRKLSERTLKGYENNNLGLFRFLMNEYQMTELEEIHHKAIQSDIQFLTEKKLKETYINIMGKGRKQRYVPIAPIISKVLIKYMRIRSEYIEDKFNYETDSLLLSHLYRKILSFRFVCVILYPNVYLYIF